MMVETDTAVASVLGYSTLLGSPSTQFITCVVSIMKLLCLTITVAFCFCDVTAAFSDVEVQRATNNIVICRLHPTAFMLYTRLHNQVRYVMYMQLYRCLHFSTSKLSKARSF